MRLYRYLNRACALFAAAAVSTLLLTGQVSDATLSGTLMDETEAVIPGATVVLVNTGTGVRHTRVSDERGYYVFPNVPAGSYSVEAQAAGFSPKSVRGLDLRLNRKETLNLTMQVAAVGTTVDVVDALPALDTSTAWIQTTFGATQATSLPLTSDGAAGVLNLSLLGAGVTSGGGIGYGTGPSVGGQRPTNNNFAVEGVDNNDRAATGPVINVSNEAVAEFTVGQNQFSPEFGHSSGGQFNTTVKSGSNVLHGSLYEYFQNRALDALDQSFARQGVTAKPRRDMNRFGGTIGGPIQRNRLFYFGALEYQPVGLAATSPGAVYAPTSEGLAMLSGMAVNKTNLNVFTQHVPAAASRAYDIQVAGRAIPVGTLNLVGASYANHLRPVVAVDYNPTERDQIRGRWMAYRTDSIDTSMPLPSFYSPIRINNQLASAAYFRTLSAGLTNELRLGYTRRAENRSVGDHAFPGLDAFPTFIFNDLGLSMGGFFPYPQSNRSNLFQAANNVNWLRGRHSLKFGYDVRKVNSTNTFIQRQRGEYEYRSFERYLLDIMPERAQRSVGGFPFAGNLVSHYAFVNDEIRLRPNLTVSLGVRYEFVGVPAGAQLQSLNAVSNVPGVLEFRAPTASKTDFAPRLGLAWSPGTSGRTSVRAGFGLTYDQYIHNLALNSLPPQFFTSVDAHIESPGRRDFLANGGISPTAVPVVSPAIARQNTSTWIPDQLRPYSLQWNAGVQHVFAQDYTIDVRYLGTRGVHLPIQTQMNRQAAVTSPETGLPTFLSAPSQATLDSLSLTLAALQPVNTLAPHGFMRTITSYQPRGNSSYHGLATQLTRRMSAGLQFTASHTWSHNIDDSTAVVASTVLTPRRAQDFFNLAAERADSALDRRHRTTAGWTWETPWLRSSSSGLAKHLLAQWTLSGTFIAETGAWATVRSGIDSNLNGDNAGDRTVINVAGDPARSSAVTALSNSGGQVVGYLATDPGARYIQAGRGVYPNAGRNTLRLPGINNFDLALGKRFRLKERASVDFRAEAYNGLNHPQYVPGYANSVNPRPRVDGGSTALLLAGSPVFNRPDRAFESNARTLQLVLRIAF